MNPLRIALVSFSLLTTSLYAQSIKLNKGDIEVGGSAQLDSDVMAGTAHFGVFVMDYLQAGIKVELADSDAASRFGLGVYMVDLFETNTYLLPYAGGSLGYGSLDIDGGKSESGVEFALIGGLKYYMDDNVSLNTELLAGYSTSDSYLGNKGGDASKIQLTLGISFLW